MSACDGEAVLEKGFESLEMGCRACRLYFRVRGGREAASSPYRRGRGELGRQLLRVRGWGEHRGSRLVIRSASCPSLKWLASLSAPWSDFGSWSCRAMSRARALRSDLLAEEKSLRASESILVMRRI